MKPTQAKKYLSDHSDLVEVESVIHSHTTAETAEKAIDIAYIEGRRDMLQEIIKALDSNDNTEILLCLRMLLADPINSIPGL